MAGDEASTIAEIIEECGGKNGLKTSNWSAAALKY